MNPDQNRQPHSSFWPLALLAVSFCILLVWQVTVSAQQYLNGIRLRDQQVALAQQATQAEENLKNMMMELLDMAKTDADALAITKTHRITYNAPAQPALPPDLVKPQPTRKETNAPAAQPAPRPLRPTGSRTDALPPLPIE
jgi:hypothetical protein